MKILVTGAKGFVGKNLCAALKNVQEGKDKTRGIDSNIEIFEFDIFHFSTAFHSLLVGKFGGQALENQGDFEFCRFSLSPTTATTKFNYLLKKELIRKNLL